MGAKRVSVSLVVLALLVIAAPVSAFDLGARAMGMGGAYVALADDATAVYWNPAGLTQVKHVSVVPSVGFAGDGGKDLMVFLDAINNQEVPSEGVTINLGASGLAGLATKRFAVSYMPMATVSGGVTMPEPPADPLNLGDPDSVAAYTEYQRQLEEDGAYLNGQATLVNATVLSGAIPIAKAPFGLGELAVGANVKLLNGRGYQIPTDTPILTGDTDWQGNMTAEGVGVDLGAQARFTKWLKGGLVVRNAYNSLKWKNNDGSDAGLDAPDPSYEAGVAIKAPIPGMTIAADVERTTDTSGQAITRYKAGLEQSLLGILTVRAGGYTNPGGKTVYTGGFGVGLFRFARLEFAVASDLEDTYGLTGTIIAQF